MVASQVPRKRLASPRYRGRLWLVDAGCRDVLVWPLSQSSCWSRAVRSGQERQRFSRCARLSQALDPAGDFLIRRCCGLGSRGGGDGRRGSILGEGLNKGLKRCPNWCIQQGVEEMPKLVHPVCVARSFLQADPPHENLLAHTSTRFRRTLYLEWHR